VLEPVVRNQAHGGVRTVVCMNRDVGLALRANPRAPSERSRSR